MVQDKATVMGGSVAQGKDNVWEEVGHRYRHGYGRVAQNKDADMGASVAVDKGNWYGSKCGSG